MLGPFDEDDAQGLGAPNPRRFAPRMPIVVSDELRQDPSGHTTRALARLTETADGFWLHLDLDVLSASALPAVDYADERGLNWEQLGELLGVALGSSQLIGASVVILNPTLDTDGAGARRVVRLLADAQDQARQN